MQPRSHHVPPRSHRVRTRHPIVYTRNPIVLYPRSHRAVPAISSSHDAQHANPRCSREKHHLN
jgi:hypothetical protein